MIYSEGPMQQVTADLHHKFLSEVALPVNTGHWQGVEGTPHSQTLELPYTTVRTPIPISCNQAMMACDPNLPWAEHHFQERICGKSLNPGEQYKHWPWYRGGVEEHRTENGQFSHTYMERYWPKLGGEWTMPLQGIRFPYGDLLDLIKLLIEHPHTRQAYLPIWFPEDLIAARESERVPCSLGYHFMIRGRRLNVMYPMRSCDFVRYFRDDVYMTMRLAQHVAEQMPLEWCITPGTLHMHISSLHVFQNDLPKLRREAPPRP